MEGRGVEIVRGKRTVKELKENSGLGGKGDVSKYVALR